MIEIFVAGPAAEHRAPKAQTGDAAVQFSRGVCRRRGGQGGETLKPRWMCGDGGGKHVVGMPGQSDALFRFEIVKGGRGDGENLHVDAAFIHQREATLTQVVEPLYDFATVKAGRALLSDGGGCPCGTDFRRDEVLLDRDESQLETSNVL